MIANLKALVVVLGIAMFVFTIAKPVCLRFMAESDFVRRRNIWLVLTVAAFVSPSFWLFVAVAASVLLWSAPRERNPVALYLLLMHVIPPNAALEIPVVGINALFELNCYRLLVFTILVPALVGMLQTRGRGISAQAIISLEALLVAYVLLQLVLVMPHESLTNTMRRGFLFTIDFLLLYFVISRTCTTRRVLVEALAAFCLAGALYAPMALFETLKEWQLYGELSLNWGRWVLGGYLYREDSLRAPVSAGHPLALGYLMAIAFGFWLYLRSRTQGMPLVGWTALWLWIGLIAAYSRAPWIVAVWIFFCYLALSPKGPLRLVKTLAISVVLAGMVLATPIGERVIDNLPFIGSVDEDTVSYRQQLALYAWEMVKKNPWFGDPFFLLNLEDLRQGQGIIDLVNTYAAVAMGYGLVGLFLFLGPFLIAMGKTYRLVRRSAGTDPDLSLLGACLIACMTGTLLMMATGSFANGLAQMYYALVGLAGAYVRLRQEQTVAHARPLVAASKAPLRLTRG